MLWLSRHLGEHDNVPSEWKHDRWRLAPELVFVLHVYGLHTALECSCNDSADRSVKHRRAASVNMSSV